MDIEQLRYVVDSRILPGRRRKLGPSNPGRGIPRVFTGGEAFVLVAAVLMLQGGVRRRVVRECLDLLSQSIVPNSRRPGDVLLHRVFADEAVLALEIGDGLNVRLVCEDGPGKRAYLPQKWIQPKTRATLNDYDPLLLVRINLALLRAYFH